MNDKKRGLGRGLGDLISPSDWLKRDDIQLFYCPVERLAPNPYQPRQIVDDAGMEELVQSVKEKGVLQPILVTRGPEPDSYQILAGERRWRASRQAGLTEVPVILRETTSAEALELALIENLQRQDLNCIEEALAYQRLQQEFHLSQEDISNRVGKNRSTVANLLRLLQLPPDIQEDLLNQRLTMGHARTLLGVADADAQRRLRDVVLARHLSVRQTEDLVNRHNTPPKPKASEGDTRLKELAGALQAHLGTGVSLRRKGRRGSLTITFRTDEELTGLLERLGLSM